MMSLVLTIFILQACGNKYTVCPSYPNPSQEVLIKIKSLESQEVDDWILKQYKLNLKLKVCNE